MLNNETIIKVTNRSFGRTGYSLPERNVRRQFEPKQTKEITMGELRELDGRSGGHYLLENCLIIKNEEAVAELLGEVEPEYYYTEKEIKELLLTGTLDELKDCLDFAPVGVLNSVKDLAVELQLNDMNKREAIYEALSFDVTNAIRINKESQIVEEEKPKNRTRRVNTQESQKEQIETQSTGRRAAAPKYKVVK
jgi:hypothetical protein